MLNLSFFCNASPNLRLMELLDGKATSLKIKDQLRDEVSQLVQSGHRSPHLAAVLVGDDGASLTYVGAKVKACEEIGFVSTLIQRPASTTEEELLQIVKELNENQDIHGYIVQLPLPKHINEQKILLAIDPKKDVDGFHPENVGRMALNLPTYLPATPYGIIQLLEFYKVPTEGKHCVVVGRSNIVGLPVSILLQRNGYPGNCTVTITHSRTKDLASITRQADILVAAIGKPEFITGDMVKDGVVVVDVGITRIKDDFKKSGFRLAGDVHFESVAAKSSYITPVPGGVGPMTIVSLMKNTLLAAKS